MEQFFIRFIGTFETLFQVFWVAFLSLIPETTIGKVFFVLAVLLFVLITIVLVNATRDDATETNR